MGVQKMAFVIEHVCKSMNSALTIYAEKTIHLPSIYILSLANISDRPYIFVLNIQGHFLGLMKLVFSNFTW